MRDEKTDSCRQDGPLAVVTRAHNHAARTAIVDATGCWSYEEVLATSHVVASALLDGSADLDAERVAFLAPPSVQYVTAMFGIWRAGGIAVPLAVSHPEPELRYVVEDSQACVILVDDGLADHVAAWEGGPKLRVLRFSDLFGRQSGPLPRIPGDLPAMILYTSGTSGKPKGVVTTHDNIEAQVTSLVKAWEWSADDRILHVLPLHHIHGIVNCLTCALWCGATCEFLPRFDADTIWGRIEAGGITVFMAVPTIYARLIDAWERAPERRRRRMSAAASDLRIMVSGSAALPVRTLNRWRAITGQVLLERYGMTEIGMALSNPLRDERVPGSVGTPLPGVEVRLIDDDHFASGGSPGEIHVRGPGVFREYWRRPEATDAAFVDGWFRTGDVAVLEDGVYRILGRQSVDIIKSGGYKLSAVEIENAFREHESIHDCAVVGVPDGEWGERACIAIVCRDGRTIDADQVRAWAKTLLAPYKVPRSVAVVDDLPRNSMGKVLKPDVARLFADPSAPTI